MSVELCCLLFLLAGFQTGTSVRITRLFVPQSGSHEVPLKCHYELEGGKLYDVKWYKDGAQFFRCAGDGTIQEFPVDGVSTYHTGLAPIGWCPVTLTSLSSKTAGEYRCEVTLDEPSFPTVSESVVFKNLEPERRVQPTTSTLATTTFQDEETSTLENGAINEKLPHWFFLMILICIVL